MLNDAHSAGRLSESQKYDQITLSCKDESKADELGNWRPISSLNVDYKIYCRRSYLNGRAKFWRAACTRIKHVRSPGDLYKTTSIDFGMSWITATRLMCTRPSFPLIERKPLTVYLLATAIREDKRISGVKIPGSLEIARLALYADDTNSIVKDDATIGAML